MTVSARKGAYFWLINLLVIVAVFGFSARNILLRSDYSDYRVRLSEVAHYIKAGFDAETDALSGALEVPAGGNVGASVVAGGERVFLTPGALEYREFTIAARFDYTSQYDALEANRNVVPGILLPGLGDNYEIYLNGHPVASEWHVGDGGIVVHKLARSRMYPINPAFFVRGENTVVYRICGDPSSFDTGLTVTGKYMIDDVARLSPFDYPQTVFAGIYLAIAGTFFVFFLLYRERRLYLWFSVCAATISLYVFFRMGAFQNIFRDYEVSLRLEVLALFAFAYFITVLIYTCGREQFNPAMKACTAFYALFSAAVLLPGHQFVLDLVKAFFLMFVPFVIYAFVFSLCVPLARDVRAARAEDGGNGSMLRYVFGALSGTLRGNMIVGAFVPIVLALIDQMAYVVLSYQEIVLSQYGFLFFFANVTFALAADNAETQSRLMVLSGELRALVGERESELAKKSGEVEEVKTEQIRLRETVSREIRAPLGEIIGSIELQMLRSGLAADVAGWLGRLLEAQRGIRKKLDGFLGDEAEYAQTNASRPGFQIPDVGTSHERTAAASNPGGTRHMFVINPKSFVTLKDLKDFLLSIEKCFSAGHRAEYKIYISRYPRDAYSAVNRYLTATPQDEIARVYAVGGDGILFDCLNGLAKFPNAELAPIPYGNANDFARSFGADNLELFRDVKLMSKAPARLVDVIRCGDQYALCSCSIGIEAKAVQAFSKAIERINSGKARMFVPLIYNLGAVKSLLDGSQNNMNYRLTMDGEDCSGDYLFVNVGNIALNGGSNTPNPLSVPDDGILDAIICKSSSAINGLRMLPAYTRGRFGRFPDYLRHCRLKELRCESDNLMSVILDGETFYTHELDLKILPKAVKIVSPNGIGFADYSGLAKGAAR